MRWPLSALLITLCAVGNVLAQSFVLNSPAFEEGGKIPLRYTARGGELSPPLVWANPPEGTQSFLLIVDNPDGVEGEGTWVHWIVFDIPKSWQQLPEDLVYTDEFARSGIAFGRNSARGTTWRGPAAYGGEKRYYFKLYALSERLNLELSPTKDEIEELIDGKVLGIAVLTGVYG